MYKRFAKKSELITCENGHPICLVARDVTTTDVFMPTHLIAWQQPEPKHGDTEVHCSRCGGLFWHANDGGQHFHFRDGWRLHAPEGKKKRTAREWIYKLTGVSWNLQNSKK